MSGPRTSAKNSRAAGGAGVVGAMLPAASRTVTSRYTPTTGRLLAQERLLWECRVELAQLEVEAGRGADVAEALAVARARLRTLESAADFAWALERARLE